VPDAGRAAGGAGRTVRGATVGGLALAVTAGAGSFEYRVNAKSKRCSLPLGPNLIFAAALNGSVAPCRCASSPLANFAGWSGAGGSSLLLSSMTTTVPLKSFTGIGLVKLS
jgi:hypothetical protein